MATDCFHPASEHLQGEHKSKSQSEHRGFTPVPSVILTDGWDQGLCGSLPISQEQNVEGTQK